VRPNLFLRGNVGTAFKLPTAEEKSRRLNVSIGGGVPTGAGSFSCELIGFARNVTDLIDYVYDPVQDLDQISNVPGKGEGARERRHAAHMGGELHVQLLTAICRPDLRRQR
jgi:hypothetical protein